MKVGKGKGEDCSCLFFFFWGGGAGGEARIRSRTIIAINTSNIIIQYYCGGMEVQNQIFLFLTQNIGEKTRISRNVANYFFLKGVGNIFIFTYKIKFYVCIIYLYLAKWWMKSRKPALYSLRYSTLGQLLGKIVSLSSLLLCSFQNFFAGEGRDTYKTSIYITFDMYNGCS